MKFERSSGIILHPTCLPGPYGIGDIGPQAERWINFLEQSRCKLWQILPLGPTGYGDSPYQCFSAFAGNPYLISPEVLLKDGLLSTDDLIELPDFSDQHVKYGTVIPWKFGVLDRAYIQFEHNASENLRKAFTKYQHDNKYWLEDFTLFMALKEAHGGKPWVNWDPSLRDREPDALAEARQKYHSAIQRQSFRQFIFNRQWCNLKKSANQKGIQIIGDIPIFVAHDSADVWSHPELFFLDSTGNPTVVAGVPPDYFSPTGQLWGNPLYNWEAHQAQRYSWWLDRLRAVLSLVDIVRLGHFRGFAGYWEIPADAPTAETGQWVAAPGRDLLLHIQEALGDLPIIAEDLGVITPDVEELRDDFDLPGMKILQFAFSGNPAEPFLPHNYPRNCAVYTGTHDNDTVLGWYRRVSEDERSFYRRYLDREGTNVSWDLIRACWASCAIFSLAPMQDFLSLGNEARMNYPGNPSGNWSWRMSAGAINDQLAERIKELNFLYSRSDSVTDTIPTIYDN